MKKSSKDLREQAALLIKRAEEVEHEEALLVSQRLIRLARTGWVGVDFEAVKAEVAKLI